MNSLWKYVRRKVWRHWVDAQEEVDSRLLVSIGERVGIISLHALEYVARMRGPLIDLSVCVCRVSQCRTSVLHGNGVTQIVIHLRQHVDSIRVERQ